MLIFAVEYILNGMDVESQQLSGLSPKNVYNCWTGYLRGRPRRRTSCRSHMIPFIQSMRSDLLSSSYADAFITFFAALSMAPSSPLCSAIPA